MLILNMYQLFLMKCTPKQLKQEKHCFHFFLYNHNFYVFWHKNRSFLLLIFNLILFLKSRLINNKYDLFREKKCFRVWRRCFIYIYYVYLHDSEKNGWNFVNKS